MDDIVIVGGFCLQSDAKFQRDRLERVIAEVTTQHIIVSEPYYRPNYDDWVYSIRFFRVKDQQS